MPAAAQEPPAVLMEEVELAFATCAQRGGAARIGDGFQIRADLNGDGVADFVTDLAAIDCAGAPDALCAPTGCPVTAWLSEPGGTFARFDLGYLRGVELLPAGDGDLPVLRAEYHQAHCGEDAGPMGCTRSWTFAENAPAQPAPDPAPERPATAPPTPAGPGPDATAGPLLPGEASRPATDLPEGWTLRRVSEEDVLALGRGTGRVASLAAFCLHGVPFLALHTTEELGREQIALSLAFSEGTVTAEAGLEESAGGAYVLALAEGPLAARLAGRDSRVALAIDGIDEGELSLNGSTRSIRAALAACHDF